MACRNDSIITRFPTDYSAVLALSSKDHPPRICDRLPSINAGAIAGRIAALITGRFSKGGGS